MAIKLFGFKIGRDDAPNPLENQSFAAEDNLDGALQVAPMAGAYGTYIDIEGAIKGEAEAITRYREMTMFPEAEYAVDDIINEAIVVEENKGPVVIRLDDLELSDGIKTKVKEEFDEILDLLDFHSQCYEIFRRWYVDGRLYYHLVVNVKRPQEGIQELRYIDPRKIRKIKHENKKPVGNDGPAGQGVPVVVPGPQFYLFNEAGLDGAGKQAGQNIKIASDSISYNHSGLLDPKKSMVVSHLHKALKPYNQLKMLEDALVIYRISRAPERRIFYVDVGNLPRVKAEQYLHDIMVKFKNKVVYDSTTGDISDDRHQRTMLEDYWLPRREGGKGTEISTLPGGQNLGEIEDVLYFRKKLYRAMNVPPSRMEQDGGFNIGRSAEITRDEVKFGKFITRLRLRFSHLFLNLLEKQLRLKGIITSEDWIGMKKHIHFDWMKDTHFIELQEQEISRARIELLNEADSFVGNYFSKEWIRKNVLRQTDDEIKEIEKQINSESEEDSTSNEVEMASQMAQIAPPPVEGPPGAEAEEPEAPSEPKPPQDD